MDRKTEVKKLKIKLARSVVLIVLLILFLPLNFASANEEANKAVSADTGIEQKIYSKISSWFGEDKAIQVKATVVEVKKRFSAFWKDEKPAVEEPIGPSDTAVEKIASDTKVESEQKQSAIAERLSEFPSYKQADPTSVVEQVSKARGSLSQQKLFGKVDEGRAGTNTNAVIVKGKPFPRLDLGLEPRIQKQDLMPIAIDLKKGLYQSAKPLKTPKLLMTDKEWAAFNLKAIPVVKGPTEVDQKKWKLQKPVTRESIAKRMPQISPEDTNHVVQPYVEFSPVDLSYLAARIEYEKGRCHNVIGVAQPLLKVDRYAEDAKFWVGICSAKNGLQSDQVHYLLPFVKNEHPLYFNEALEYLLKDLRAEYFTEIADDLRKISVATSNAALKSRINYVMARDADRQDQYAKVMEYAPQVAEGTEYYFDAQFLLAVAYFTKQRSLDAEKTLKSLRAKLDKAKEPNRNIQSLVALTLARVAFDRKNYNLAIEEYRKVDKNHGAWIQAMTELGWSQIMSGDYAGAIGNMYSLHSPFFESVYKPESFAVRAIGYLNICQYGDAYKAISRLEGQHRGWIGKINQYTTVNKTAGKYYETVSKYLSQKNSKLEVDGLPPQMIREMARRRNFLNAQTMINDKIDEKQNYNVVNAKIGKDIAAAKWSISKANGRMLELNAQLRSAKTNNQLKASVNEWTAQMRSEQKLITGYKHQIELYSKAKQDFLPHVRRSVARMNIEEGKLRKFADTALRSNLKEMGTQMTQLLENNEFLRFEAFAGSGENIRYQVGGGETSVPSRIPADVKPKKILNWDFDGEFWEDEIGSYRSSLRNNCPKYNGQANLGNATSENE
jgi:hypothetical protein